MEHLQRAIERRQKELHEVTTVLAKSARKYSLLAALGTTLIVALGSFVATRDIALALFADAKTSLTIIYTLSGLVIATTAGLEAAFRFKDKAAKLHLLAATTEATYRKTDTKWRKEVAGGYGVAEQAAQRLLDMQDEILEQTARQAAELGVNLTLELGELSEWSNRHAA